MRVVLLVAALALVGYEGYRHVQAAADHQRFAEVAGAIAGREVSIHCQSLVGELVDVNDRHGYVEFDTEGHPGDEAKLDRRTCQALSRLLHGRPDSVARSALAVEVLAHEAYHLAGVQDEAAAECYGLQAVTFVARSLGATPGRAASLAAHAAARYPELRDEYRSADCRNGGALDLHPELASWP